MELPTSCVQGDNRLRKWWPWGKIPPNSVYAFATEQGRVISRHYYYLGIVFICTLNLKWSAIQKWRAHLWSGSWGWKIWEFLDLVLEANRRRLSSRQQGGFQSPPRQRHTFSKVIHPGRASHIHIPPPVHLRKPWQIPKGHRHLGLELCFNFDVWIERDPWTEAHTTIVRTYKLNYRETQSY